MKFLEYTNFGRLNSFLEDVNLGGRSIKGSLEGYSCKHVRNDKRLFLSLEKEILDDLAKSSEAGSSTSDDVLLRSRRKSLIYLVLTLYQLHPDYDFSDVKAYQFFSEQSWDSFEHIFNDYMSEAAKAWIEKYDDGSLLGTVYRDLDEVVKLAECEIYAYHPNSDADPCKDIGAIWYVSFFFYNRNLKRVVSFRFYCISNIAHDEFPGDTPNLEDKDMD